MLTYFLSDFYIWNTSFQVVSQDKFVLACGILETYPRSISIFTYKLLDLYSLDKNLCGRRTRRRSDRSCNRRPEEDLIGFEAESWKTQGKTSSWHPPETEEDWIPTPSETRETSRQIRLLRDTGQQASPPQQEPK